MSRRYCMPSKEICSDAGVGARDGLGEIGAAADDGQHAAAGGDELPVSHRRAGVIDRHAGSRFGASMPLIGWPDSDDSG